MILRDWPPLKLGVIEYYGELHFFFKTTTNIIHIVHDICFRPNIRDIKLKHVYSYNYNLIRLSKVKHSNVFIANNAIYFKGGKIYKLANHYFVECTMPNTFESVCIKPYTKALLRSTII